MVEVQVTGAIKGVRVSCSRMVYLQLKVNIVNGELIEVTASRQYCMIACSDNKAPALTCYTTQVNPALITVPAGSSTAGVQV